MAGCKSCSNCSPNHQPASTKKAEKLTAWERSANPRYPHVLVGKQAMYSDCDVQIIVTVVADECDEECDSFTLKAQTILKDSRSEHAVGESFDVSQPAGERCWKLHALS
jgi:hypothetical protein